MQSPSLKGVTLKKAFKQALKMRKIAHAPYSRFRVGAALVSRRGEVALGCNIENASYGATVCAERVAIWKSVSTGVTDFSDIVIVTDAPEPAFPCALCLQVMAEFFRPDTRIWIGDLKGVRSVHEFRELLPFPFGPNELKSAGT